MPVIRGIVVGVVGIALVIAIAACGLALTNEVLPASGDQALSVAPGTPTPQQTGNVVWGRVPYCSCLIDSATANVASALKKANLAVRLKEQSPRDGWLYFAVTFDPYSATEHQVGAAMLAGGAEVLKTPP